MKACTQCGRTYSSHGYLGFFWYFFGLLTLTSTRCPACGASIR